MVDHSRSTYLRVYPHLRGADRIRYGSDLGYSGVSPPAWGRQHLQTRACTSKRCIPTCVGQTYCNRSDRFGYRVYPHLRGADQDVLAGSKVGIGVSPPAWGRRQCRARCIMSVGCIPTCVGQTDGFTYPPRVIWVYPHLRGADYIGCVYPMYPYGVSPPAWGRPLIHKKFIFHIKSKNLGLSHMKNHRYGPSK